MCLTATVLLMPCIAQERAFQVGGTGTRTYMITATPFADYDNDGVRDLMVGVIVDYLNWPVAYAANRILGEAEVSPNYQRLLGYGDAEDVGDICAAGDENAILARMRRFADAGATDLSVRLLPIGDNRDELVASKRRTREMIAELATELR